MRTFLTATAFVLAVPAGAALADTKCNVPTENMQSWESLVQVANDLDWTISEMKLDDGCYELKVTDSGGNFLKMTVDPGTLDVVKAEVKRWSDGTRPEKSN